MRKKVDDPRLMIKVCDLYYNQNASRQEIGVGLHFPDRRLQGFWIRQENRDLSALKFRIWIP